VILGEVNLPYGEQLRYFGESEGNELHMMFDFMLMQATYLSFARADGTPLARALAERPEIHRTCAWATFLRNHDKLTPEERQEVFDAFGPEPDMQLYGRGLRRRLPPMLDGDPRRIRMAYSLLFSLPGTPTLFYGEEIGMGENLDIPGRLAVRAPMQWGPGQQGGFSTAPPHRLTRPVVGDGYSPQHVNAADQVHDPDSMWSFVRTLIMVRRACPEIGWGTSSVLDVGSSQVFAHRCELEQASVVALHNLSADPVVVTVPATTGDGENQLVDAFTHERLGMSSESTEVSLEGYGHTWLRVRRRDGLPKVP
jgi:glycosidase